LEDLTHGIARIRERIVTRFVKNKTIEDNGFWRGILAFDSNVTGVGERFPAAARSVYAAPRQPIPEPALSLPLLALVIASFGIGTTEFVIMGLLPDVAWSLRVSVPHAGLLVSGYAYGVAFGSPLIAIARPRRPALVMLMAIFTIGNIGCAVAPTYAALMVARVATALAHGAFFGIGSVVARDLAAPNRRTQAVAIMFAGLTLANVLGVPFGTALGQALGWRAPFWAVALIGLVAGGAIARFIPAGLTGSTSGLAAEFLTLRHPRVLFPMAISTLSSVSLFIVVTYITPLLEHVSGLSPHGVTIALLLFGLGLTVGNLAGGRLADWRLTTTVIGAFVAVIAVMILFTATSHSAGAAMATLTIWGALAFALVSPLQIWVVDAASDAPNLAATLNQGAFNFGNASGAWIGGLALDAGLGYGALPWLGAAVAAIALALTLVAARGAVAGRVAMA
jgi:DHA1 family inner membrane transport protein